MYCSEESGEDNDVGASGSIKEQREKDKREQSKEGGSCSPCILLSQASEES